MSEDLANALISEAESVVEVDLSPRYMAPFQPDEGGAFSGLPANPTQAVIKTLCELMSCIRILETDFGTGSAVNGEKYKASLETRYKAYITDLLSKRKDGSTESQGWRLPPLPSLRLNYMNSEADDGFMGMVIIASGSQSQGFAAGQINDPSLGLFNGFYWP